MAGKTDTNLSLCGFRCILRCKHSSAPNAVRSSSLNRNSIIYARNSALCLLSPFSPSLPALHVFYIQTISSTVSKKLKTKSYFSEMGCVSEDTSVSLTRNLSTSMGFEEKANDNDEEKSVASVLNFLAYGVEKVFPLYAMGNLELDDGLESKIGNLELGINEEDPIWEAVRAEAKLEAEKEPILSSFLYASIMSHDCLERALGFILANRLQNPVLLAAQLMDIFVDVMMHDRGIQRSIRLDAQAFKDRDPSCLAYCWVLLYLKGYHSLQSYRVAHALWNRGRKVLALALQSRISEVFGVDIHPAAKIGEGILLDHGTGVVIGETAVIGNKVSLMQGVTLGGSGKEIGDRHPKIGQGALIGPGAIILGNIRIGDGAMIAAGSLVLKDIPPHSIVAGIPAKVVGYVEGQDPSLTMKQDATKEIFLHDAAHSRTGKA